MIACDFHLHTVFGDGKNTPEEVAEQALADGIEILGFSEHSYLPFEEFSMQPEVEDDYIARVSALKETYEGRMTVLCGLEKDYYSTVREEKFDYVIGSVHYVKCGDAYASIDLSPEATEENVKAFFGGDPYAYAKAYFALEADLFHHVKADIIGHIDLLTKFHEKSPLLDTQDKRYVTAWKEAVEALIPYGKPFEINSGAISRGWRTTPYPAPEILRFIKERGGHIILSSDSHAKNTLRYRFEQSRELALACGFTTQLVPTGEGFAEVNL